MVAIRKAYCKHCQEWEEMYISLFPGNLRCTHCRNDVRTKNGLLIWSWGELEKETNVEEISENIAWMT